MKRIKLIILIVLLGIYYSDLSAQCGIPISSFPHIESFENGLVSWLPTTTATFCTETWARKTGSTLSSNTGPNSASDGRYYIYTESSSGCSNKTFEIESNCYDLSGHSSATITFDYHMFGVNIGSLNLEISRNNGGSWSSLWSKNGSQGNSNANSTIKLRFRGVTGFGYRSDMAIDNLSIRTGSGGGTASCFDGMRNQNETGVDCGGVCPACDTGNECGSAISNFPHVENFENASASWSPLTTSVSCTGIWARKSGRTASSSTGPNSASLGSYYIYTESSSSCSNRTLEIESPCYNLSGHNSANFTFDYHMFGENTGSLNLEISTNSGSTWTALWSRSGDQGSNWRSESISLNGNNVNKTIKLRFRGVTGSGFRSDMAIDNLSIQTGSGGTMETCSDGIQNQNETGVDCGGVCSNCMTSCVCPFDVSIPNKHIKVFLHYVMRSNGSGNFNKDDDGFGNTNNNAYAFTKLLIKEVNKKLSQLHPNWRTPQGNVIATDANWRVVVSGINFIQDDALYEFDHFASGSAGPYLPLRKDPNNNMNIFILNQANRNGTPSFTSGQAYRSSKMTIHTDRSYNNYVAFNRNFEDFIIREAAGNFIHELGHVLDLNHDWNPQFCDMELYSSSCNSGCSNNYMSLNYAEAAWAGSLSSCQIEHMIDDIERTHRTTVIERSDNCTPQYSNSHLEVNTSSSSTDFWLYTGNFDYNSYFIESYQTSCEGCTNVINGTYLSSWYNKRSSDLEHKISLHDRTSRNFASDSWYRIKFVVRDPCGNWIESNNWINSSQSNQIVSETDLPLKSINQKTDVVIYPNPTSDEVKVQTISALHSVTLLSMSGRLLGEYTSDTFDVSSLPPGIYFLKIVTVNGNEHRRRLIVGK